MLDEFLLVSFYQKKEQKKNSPSLFSFFSPFLGLFPLCLDYIRCLLYHCFEREDCSLLSSLSPPPFFQTVKFASFFLTPGRVTFIERSLFCFPFLFPAISILSKLQAPPLLNCTAKPLFPSRSSILSSLCFLLPIRKGLLAFCVFLVLVVFSFFLFVFVVLWFRDFSFLSSRAAARFSPFLLQFRPQLLPIEGSLFLFSLGVTCSILSPFPPSARGFILSADEAVLWQGT